MSDFYKTLREAMRDQVKLGLEAARQMRAAMGKDAGK
jgi:hypothetical protein